MLVALSSFVGPMPEFAVVGFGRRIHFLIEGGKEKVLQNSLVVSAIVGVNINKNVIQFALVKKVVRYQPLLFYKPNEYKAGDQSNDAGCITDIRVRFSAFGKGNVLYGPKIPVCHFPEKSFLT